MAIAEGRSLPFVGPEHVDVAVLETFPYEGPEQEIVTETDEFSAVCPYSGLPDFAKLVIRYVPGGTCIELKSLKYYVTSLSNRRPPRSPPATTLAPDPPRCRARSRSPTASCSPGGS